MTNQQGAPEALTDFERRHAIRQGYEIAASDRYFEARPQIDSSDRRKAFQAGFERGWDRHAALVEAQQPSPSAAPTQDMIAAVLQLVDLEQGDVEDPRYDDGSKLAEQICKAVVALVPQPSHTPQADSHPAPVRGKLLPCPCCGGEAAEHDRLNSNTVRCLSCGLRVKQSEMGMGDAAKRWNSRAARAPADSAPGAVTVERAIQIAASLGVREYGPNTRNWSFDYAQIARFVAALTAPQADSQPAPTHAQIAAYLKATGAYVTNDATREAAIAEAVNADRAARAPADSVTAPAAGAVAGPTREQMDAAYAVLWPDSKCNPTLEERRRITIRKALTAAFAAAPTPPAQAADSVLESYTHPISGMTADELWMEVWRLRVRLRDLQDSIKADSVLEDAARLWDAFVEAWCHEVGVDKIVNIVGGAEKLKAVFLDAARKQGGV